MLWEWFWFQLPWWLKVILIGIPLAVAYAVVGMTVGWDKMRRWIVPGAIFLVTLGLVNRFQQQGWKAKEERDRQIAEDMAQRAEEVREEIREEIRQRPDRLRDNDGFRRD